MKLLCWLLLGATLQLPLASNVAAQDADQSANNGTGPGDWAIEAGYKVLGF